MPPWPARLLPPGSRNEPRVNTNNSASPARTRSRVTEADILENAYGIPSLPSPNTGRGTSGASKPTRTPSHGRSMSHPFTLFSGKKKRHGASAPKAGFESTDEDTSSPVTVQGVAQNSSARQKVPDKDLTTGKCMTCDSTVRWPKQLKVFRCTVCLTINDLKPIALETRHGDGHRAPVVFRSGTAFVPRVSRLCLEKTRQIVDQCVTTYLLDRMKHQVGGDGSPEGSQPSSPIKSSKATGKQRDLSTAEPPIHLSGRPIALADGTNIFNHDIIQAESTPYSRSSPGNFFGAHMEQRDRDIASGRTRGGPTSHSDQQYPEGDEQCQPKSTATAKTIFKPLEEYITASFGSFECINASFSTSRPAMTRAATEDPGKRFAPSPVDRPSKAEIELSEMDAKTLLLGNIAENGSWWTGSRSEVRSPEKSRTGKSGESQRDNPELATLKSPRIDWDGLNEWYHIALNPGRSWRKKLDGLTTSDTYSPRLQTPSTRDLEDIAEQMMEAQSHAQRVLLKAVESLLRRPGRPLSEPSDLRFLLIMLANPLLYPSYAPLKAGEQDRSRSKLRDVLSSSKPALGGTKVRSHSAIPATSSKGSSGQHSGIIKRILGLLAHVSNDCHHHLVSWFARYPDGQFQKTTDLIGSFVTYRLTRQHGKRREADQDLTADLIPSFGSGPASSAALHAALGSSTQPAKKTGGNPKPVVYNDDWQIKASARVMALLFAANNSGLARRELRPPQAGLVGGHSAGLAARERAHYHGQIIPISDFYNTLLDYSDLIADFEAWESRRGKFAFCQYPFFLSIWAKIQIMEHDAKRQMEVMAREAFFDSVMTRKAVNQYLVLKIRRECLVEDSLQGVSETVGSGSQEIKKGLRIDFRGEEGIDAGGLRKEWFLLLVREVFNPEHGMFTYDEDSGFCFFNPNSFETTDQFFLVGVVLGLAIYNSTILDVALPSFAFRKLLAAGPAAAPGATSHAKPTMSYSIEDLAEYRPSLAKGLRQLLEFDGDVETTFCRDFVADVDRYGQLSQVPLCPDGEKRPVTNANRREFVDLYVRYLLDTAVTRQFEPFKRGFFTVCGGNALSLFRPEEIELLIRGSDEPLDIASLRAVAKCENWGVPNAAETEPVVQWFWESFQAATPKDQRKMLSFVTGSDRIPAMGATSLIIKLSCLGPDGPRFPVARTCFNMLSLWRYSSREKLEDKLWRAVFESEGFGLK